MEEPAPVSISNASLDLSIFRIHRDQFLRSRNYGTLRGNCLQNYSFYIARVMGRHLQCQRSEETMRELLIKFREQYTNNNGINRVRAF